MTEKKQQNKWVSIKDLSETRKRKDPATELALSTDTQVVAPLATWSIATNPSGKHPFLVVIS